MNMSYVPPGGRCESDEGSADRLGDSVGAGDAFNSPEGAGIGEVSNGPDGAGVRQPSDGADGVRSECDDDADDRLVGMGLARKESRSLILSRKDFALALRIGEAIACRR